MDKLAIDFTQLVNETYAPQKDASQDAPPCSPGIFYNISQQTHTYQIEAIPSKNMSEEGRGEQYFATPTPELAQVLAESVAHKRFPKIEGAFYNIGDPTENWWMVHEDHSLRILFRSHGLGEGRERAHVLLGPLGDPSIAIPRFERLLPHLKNCFPISQFDLSKKMFQVTTLRGEDGDIPAGFEEFKKLFIEGIAGQNLLQRIAENDFPTIFHYLNELSTVRRFWIKIYQLLEENSF